MASTSKTSSVMTSPTITIGPALVRSRGNSSEVKDDPKLQKMPKSQALNSSLNLSQNTVSKPNNLQKQTKVTEQVVSSQSDSTDYVEID